MTHSSPMGSPIGSSRTSRVSFCILLVLCAMFGPGQLPFLFLNMLPRNFVHIFVPLHVKRKPQEGGKGRFALVKPRLQSCSTCLPSSNALDIVSPAHVLLPRKCYERVWFCNWSLRSPVGCLVNTFLNTCSEF